MLNFKKLTLSDKQIYLDLFANFPPYADLFFNNLFTWLSQKSEIEWAVYKEAIVLKFIDPFSSKLEYSYTFLAIESADFVVQYLSDKYNVDSFFMLPEISVSNMRPATLKEFTITKDYDNSDYIYDAVSISLMLGPRSKGFLRQINYFLKNHSQEVLAINLDLSLAKDLERLINAIHQWDVLYTHNDRERQESIALDFYFKEAPILRPQCLAVIIDGKVEAFSLYTYLPQKEYIILSHAKSSYEYKGLFDFLIYCTASRAIADRGIKYINFEQDLGIEGLRSHKESMKPIKRLAKYTLIKNHH